MPSYDGASQVTAAGSSSDYRIAALVNGLKWAAPTITYSFPNADALWPYGQPDYSDFRPLTEAERDMVRKALAMWQSIIAVPIVEVADGVNVGDMRIMGGWGNSPTQSGGNFPNQGPSSGDVGYADQNITLATAQPGSYDWMVVLHELGHALGLKHPHDGNANLPAGEDDMTRTIMSYHGYPSTMQTTPMVYDILAMQYLYGANHSFHAGDDVYTYDDSHPYDETIWDGGGNDTIRYSGINRASINLGEGQASWIGQPIFESSTQVANVWIAFGTTIENAEGGSGNDFLTGNDAANRLVGNGGSDQLYGGAGDDTLVGGDGADIFEFGLYGNGVDTIEDLGGDDAIRVDTAVLNGTMSPGDGTAVGRFEVQYQEGGAFTTFFIGTNTTPGADVTFRVAGGYAASQFTIARDTIALLREQPGVTPGTVVIGTGGNDMLTGTDGNDTVDGSGGLDTFVAAGAHSSFSVVRNGTHATVSSAQQADMLNNVERVLFSDNVGIALDVDGHAGQAYRLYQAAFDRAPDLGGLGYQMNDLDLGYSLSHVAANFIASPEFQSKYGNALDDAAFVTLLYQHVLHRNPQQFEVDYHVDNELHAGYSRADVLTFFSESPEDQANVIGQIGNGMLYVPVA